MVQPPVWHAWFVRVCPGVAGRRREIPCCRRRTFGEHEPVNFFGHSLSRVDIGAMSAKRSHSLIELRVRQTRQEGVGAQCRLPNEAWPVWGYDLRDDFMVPRREAGRCKVRVDLVAGWEVGVEHGPQGREKVW